MFYASQSNSVIHCLPLGLFFIFHVIKRNVDALAFCLQDIRYVKDKRRKSEAKWKWFILFKIILSKSVDPLARSRKHQFVANYTFVHVDSRISLQRIIISLYSKNKTIWSLSMEKNMKNKLKTKVQESSMLHNI